MPCHARTGQDRAPRRQVVQQVPTWAACACELFLAFLPSCLPAPGVPHTCAPPASLRRRQTRSSVVSEPLAVQTKNWPSQPCRPETCICICVHLELWFLLGQPCLESVTSQPSATLTFPGTSPLTSALVAVSVALPHARTHARTSPQATMLSLRAAAAPARRQFAAAAPRAVFSVSFQVNTRPAKDTHCAPADTTPRSQNQRYYSSKVAKFTGKKDASVRLPPPKLVFSRRQTHSHVIDGPLV